MLVPFGFSVGDYLVVTELTWKVVLALRESAGSVPEVRSFLETLTAFQRVISTFQAPALEWTQLQDEEITIAEKSVENGVNHQLWLCCEKLERLAKTIEPFTRSCMKQKGTRTSRDQMNKIKWILKKEDAEPLQRDLLIHIQGLEAYTSTLGM